MYVSPIRIMWQHIHTFTKHAIETRRLVILKITFGILKLLSYELLHPLLLTPASSLMSGMHLRSGFHWSKCWTRLNWFGNALLICLACLSFVSKWQNKIEVVTRRRGLKNIWRVFRPRYLHSTFREHLLRGLCWFQFHVNWLVLLFTLRYLQYNCYQIEN